MTARRALWGVLLAVLLGAAGAGGYLAGEEPAPTTGEADAERRAAYVDALDAAKREARAKALASAHSKGLKEGRADGERLGSRRGETAGDAEVELRRAADAAATAEADAAEEPVVVCDGAIADDAHHAACLEQSGAPIPPGFPGGPAGCPTEPPFPVEGACADVRP